MIVKEARFLFLFFIFVRGGLCFHHSLIASGLTCITKQVSHVTSFARAFVHWLASKNMIKKSYSESS